MSAKLLKNSHLYFAVIAVALVFLIPPFEAPDEPSHLDYANYVARNLALPIQSDAAKCVSNEGVQPPVYYFVAAMFIRALRPDHQIAFYAIPNPRSARWGGPRPDLTLYDHCAGSFFKTGADRNSFYALRLLSVLFAVATVLLNRKIVCRIFADDHWRLAAMAFVVTLPQFSFISATINSDNLSNLVAAAAALAMLNCATDPTSLKGWFWAGIWCGLALTVKSCEIFLIGASLLLWLYLLITKALKIRQAVTNLGAFLIPVALVGGWVVVRYWILYGSPLPEWLFQAANKSSGENRPLFSLVPMVLMWARMFCSFVANFGWMNIRLPLPAYTVHLILFGAAVWGVVRFARLGGLRDPKWVCALILVAANFAGVFMFNLYFNQPQGRYLFPSLGLIAALTALGWKTWVEHFSRRSLSKPFIATQILFFLLFQSVSWYWMLTRYYAYY